MKDNYLRAIEPLLRNCHELAIDAREAASEGRLVLTPVTQSPSR